MLSINFSDAARASMGTYSQPIGPQYLPTYSAFGLYSAGLGAASANFSSIMCDDQPAILEIAKMGVLRSTRYIHIMIERRTIEINIRVDCLLFFFHHIFLGNSLNFLSNFKPPGFLLV